MICKTSVSVLILTILLPFAVLAQQPKVDTVNMIISKLGGIKEVSGSPTIVKTALGDAVYFDGKDDAFFLDRSPLLGNKEMTIEMIFKPEGNSPFAQRILHMGELRGPRVMFETRVTPDNMWYFDAFTTVAGGKGVALIDPKKLHPTDQWYNVTLIVYRNMVVTYVNGSPELWSALDFVPFESGEMSVGVRMNKVDWFKGTMYKIRVTPRAILPRDFLNDHEQLNKVENK